MECFTEDFGCEYEEEESMHEEHACESEDKNKGEEHGREHGCVHKEDEEEDEGFVYDDLRMIADLDIEDFITYLTTDIATISNNRRSAATIDNMVAKTIEVINLLHKLADYTEKHYPVMLRGDMETIDRYNDFKEDTLGAIQSKVNDLRNLASTLVRSDRAFIQYDLHCINDELDGIMQDINDVLDNIADMIECDGW